MVKAPPSQEKTVEQSNKKVPYDSDDEPPEEAVLCWKMDPAKSLSDWTIEIISKPNGETKVDTYHCHKIILAVGPRHSEYFAHLLQSGDRFTEGQCNTSRIELETLAAQAFPVLLDYMYNQSSKLAVNSKNAAVLHYLGQYFGLRRLRWEAREFWISDVSISNAGTYYEHARMFQDEKLLTRIGETCADCILDIPITSILLKLIDAEFLLAVLEKRDSTKWPYVSKLVVEFCRHQTVETLDAQAFLGLTDAKILPLIDVQVALDLIKLEQTVTNPAAAELTSLQDRCLKQLAVHWKSFSTTPDILAFLRTQNPLLLTTLLDRVVSTAKVHNTQTKQALESNTQTIAHLSTENRVLVAEFCAQDRRLVEEMAVKDAALAEKDRALLEKDRTIVSWSKKYNSLAESYNNVVRRTGRS
jgi:hypothetical protein